jgi:hypothetical protein
MYALAIKLATWAPPPAMVAIIFAIAYLIVGVPIHFRRGARSRDLLGTLAGIFAALAYIAYVVGERSEFHTLAHQVNASVHTTRN